MKGTAPEHNPAVTAAPPRWLASEIVDDSVLLDLPSAGPDPLPVDTALAAVLGYAGGRRPLWFRSPVAAEGRWVQVLAFGYERFDARPRTDGPLGDPDVLTAEGLHGRLDRDSWTTVRAALDDAAPLARAAIDRAAGRPFWELPAEEFSVLAEPGTVGAVLRDLDTLPGVPAGYVPAALHHREPALFPLVSRSTRRQLWPHLHEGDSGVEAVVHRELRAQARGFAALEAAVAGHGLRLTRLRLHDVLLWLSAGLRLTHATALGHALTPAVG
jgi:hypothetical protein